MNGHCQILDLTSILCHFARWCDANGLQLSEALNLAATRYSEEIKGKGRQFFLNAQDWNAFTDEQRMRRQENAATGYLFTINCVAYGNRYPVAAFPLHKRDRLSPISTLRYLVTRTSNYRPRELCHGENRHNRMSGDRYHVPLSKGYCNGGTRSVTSLVIPLARISDEKQTEVGIMSPSLSRVSPRSFNAHHR